MIAILALALAGCATRAKPAAAPAEPDYDWSTFKGGKVEEPAASSSSSSKASSKETKKDASDESAKPAASDEASSGDAKKMSSTKISGHSLSEVDADSVANAARALRLSLVSSNTIVGPEYEQLNIVFNNLSVQIVRPASSPDKSGPKVRSPKARNDDMAKTDAGFYDASADVLVLVQAPKKATSKKTLAVLLAKAPAKKNVKATKPKRVS